MSIFMQLTCLVLPNDKMHMLKSKSIWSEDDAQEKRPLIERILQLDPIEVYSKRVSFFFGKWCFTCFKVLTRGK